MHACRRGACGAPAPSARRTRARRAHTARAPAPRAAGNEIRAEGAKELAAALKTNTTLTELSLGHGIKDQAALAAIRSILQANKARPPASVRPAFASGRDPNPRSGGLLGPFSLPRFFYPACIAD